MPDLFKTSLFMPSLFMPSLFIISAAVFLAWLFASAGMHKLKNRTYYNDIINSYLPILSTSPKLLNGFRLSLGSTELLLALALLLPQLRAAGLLLSIIMLSIYAVAMIGQIVSGRRDIACGCVGPAAQSTISVGLVIRNILLLLLAAVVLFMPKQVVLLNLPALSISLLMAAFLILFYLSSEQMISNAQQFSQSR